MKYSFSYYLRIYFSIIQPMKKNDNPKPNNRGSINKGNLTIKPIPIIVIPTISRNFAM
tara:strand:- start:186 stop:359 length:174 start_codon:yes stop_codon:yes gene_type:complete